MILELGFLTDAFLEREDVLFLPKKQEAEGSLFEKGCLCCFSARPHLRRPHFALEQAKGAMCPVQGASKKGNHSLSLVLAPNT